MNLEECYEAMESNYDDVMRRLGSETLVRKFSFISIVPSILQNRLHLSTEFPFQ